jgi:hypothetical protein
VTEDSRNANLADDGYALVPSVLSRPEIERLLEELPALEGSAGTRNLLQFGWCRELAREPRLLEIIGGAGFPIRGILFDKTPSANWNLGWHQDKKIAVKRRFDQPGYYAWSEKEGVLHCQAPAELLESCVALRIHLDDCTLENGPLRVIPGSHRSGIYSKVPLALLDNPVTCLVGAGDVIAMKPLLLHASGKATSPIHRRVIHIEYCTSGWPPQLEWAFQ